MRRAGHTPAAHHEQLGVPRSLAAIDAEWMTAALGRHFPGVHVAHAAVGPVAAGTNARARVVLSYSAGTGPAAVFVKGPGRALNRLALTALGALAAEARLAVAQFAPPLEHARLYAGASDARRLAAVVVLEDVTARGATPNEGQRPLHPDEVRSGLAGLAALHARFWERPPPCGFIRPWRLAAAWAPVSLASLRRAEARLEKLGGTPLPRHSGPARLERQFRASAALAASGPLTLLHGDPHPGNTYACGDARTGFYDWQLIRRGNALHDVGYFLIGSLAPDDRRLHERALLGEYLEALARHGAPAPSLAVAFDHYRAAPAFGLATWLHTLAFATFQPPAVSLATIARFAAAYDDLETHRSLVAPPGARFLPTGAGHAPRSARDGHAAQEQ